MFFEIIIFLLILALIFFFLGLCILVHELGHLICALWRGLHVERFSIGFGKKLYGFSYKGVEYRISMLPFGGYVALPQLEPGNEPKTEDGRPLPVAKPIDRILTALSGPAFNVLLGFLLGTVVWVAGVERPREMDEFEIYQVQEESPEYEAGLRPGDRITKVNNKKISGGWNDLVHEVALTTGVVELTILRNGERKYIRYQPQSNPEWDGLGYPFFEVSLPVEIQRVEPGSPADQAGVQIGDRILKINGENIHNSFQFIQKVWEKEGEPFTMTVRRNDETLEITDIRGEPQEIEEKTRYLIGVQPGEPMVVRHLTPWWQFKNVLTTTRNTLAALISPDSLVGPRHMSGPVGIIQMNYMTIRYRGFQQGLFFVVFVSFSLAIFNLLPIPVLDGGHIVIGSLELVARRRMPEKLAWYIQAVFAILLISFMLYVTFHDIGRLGRSLQRPGEETDPPAEEVIE